MAGLLAEGARTPHEFPRALESVNLKRDGSSCEQEAREVTPVDVLGRMQEVSAHDIAGPPLEHRVANLHQVFRIPFHCYDSIDAEVLIRFPDGYLVGAEWNALEDCNAKSTQEGQLLRIGFEETGARWELTNNLRALGPHLARVPNGSRMILITAPAVT